MTEQEEYARKIPDFSEEFRFERMAKQEDRDNYLMLRKCELLVSKKLWILFVISKIEKHSSRMSTVDKNLEKHLDNIEKAYNEFPRKRAVISRELTKAIYSIEAWTQEVELCNLSAPESWENFVYLNSFIFTHDLLHFLDSLTKWKFHNPDNRNFMWEITPQILDEGRTLFTVKQLEDYELVNYWADIAKQTNACLHREQTK